MNNIRRGDIFYIERSPCRGSEQWGGRPAIVVSNNSNNYYSRTVEVVYLTTKPKKDLPTHVAIGNKSVALCEQISTVDIDRIKGYYGSCTQEEMEQVNHAMLISLGMYLIPRRIERRKD